VVYCIPVMSRTLVFAVCLLALCVVGTDAVRSTIGVPNAASTRLFKAAAQARREPTEVGEAENKTQANGWVLYKQCGESWSNDELGTAAGVTICDAGCAMSSVSMILKTKGTNVNPGTLNTWLRGHGGYEGGDELVWASVDAYGTVKMYNYYRGKNSLSQGDLQGFISKGYGVVVNVRNGEHWVLVTGHVDGNTYTVNDPGFWVDSYVYQDMSNFVVYV